MYVVVLIMGSAVFALMLALFMTRLAWTGPYPLGTLGSVNLALAVLLVVLLRTWHLVQGGRYRQPMQLLPPLRHGLNAWLWGAITLFVPSGAFVVGTAPIAAASTTTLGPAACIGCRGPGDDDCASAGSGDHVGKVALVESGPNDRVPHVCCGRSLTSPPTGSRVNSRQTAWRIAHNTAAANAEAERCPASPRSHARSLATPRLPSQSRRESTCAGGL